MKTRKQQAFVAGSKNCQVIRIVTTSVVHDAIKLLQILDFRVLKILPSDLDEVEDIKQVGNEYYFKKDVEVIDDSENEVVPVAKNEPRNDTAQFTETLDIVVLPPPTRDVDVYESSFDRVDDSGGESDKSTINLFGLIAPTVGSGLQSSTSQKRESTAESMATHESFYSTQITLTDTGKVNVTRQSDHSTLGTLPPTSGNGSSGQESLEKYPDVESNEIDKDANKPIRNSTEDDFSFNNKTFRKMQETVLEEMSDKKYGGREGYPVTYDYDDEDDLEEDDNEDDYEETEKIGHKKYISIQRTLLKHPLRQGFLMTPGYPKYYIGDSVCRWTLYAQRLQKIKLTILDLALRFDEPCRDYVEIRDLATNQTLFSSCSESTRPIEVISLQERVEVNVRTATKVAYPKRGVLIHYSALGCELPSPTPPHMTLVRRSERRVKYVCDPLYVFPDTAVPSRELVCTSKHTWNRPLPACVGEYTEIELIDINSGKDSWCVGY
ncbi:uncharacterized protein LOC131696234 [Topomyia yanbarensis]|uniref:uncharacterized protein LOC131696234 n=1 Tax=Topomyia yanbarensis TaxID=2498891 RepID=UPI00273AA5D6|nr:uncharacterized protein LOC131696234 [Topomyia yanbarensis]